jgi:hypothetical protein
VPILPQTRSDDVKNELSRRDLLGRAGLALGGLVTIGSIGCSGDEDPKTIVEACPDPGPQVAQFPYQQHMAAGFQLEVEAVKAAAYEAYFSGGCCHGAFSALVADLRRAGQPYTLLPLDFGKFGGGGMGYGSVCGSALAGVLVMNLVVADTTARGNMITALLRWYETFKFPQFSPATRNVGEEGSVLDFSQSNLVNIGTVAGSHLCHASLSTFAGTNGVAANGKDKHARCARVTADVAGKTAEMLNQYLLADPKAYPAVARDSVSAGCVTCHSPASTGAPPAVNSGMACTTCHTDKATGHGGL